MRRPTSLSGGRASARGPGLGEGVEDGDDLPQRPTEPGEFADDQTAVALEDVHQLVEPAACVRNGVSPGIVGANVLRLAGAVVPLLTTASIPGGQGSSAGAIASQASSERKVFSQPSPKRPLLAATQLCQDVLREAVADLAMAQDGLGNPRLGMAVPVMPGSGPHQHAAALVDLFDERRSLHATAISPPCVQSSGNSCR